MTIGLIAKIGSISSPPPAPSYEDLTTFTEVDEDSDITLTTDKCDVSTMRRDAVSYVYKDYGVSHFGDFDIDFEVEVTAGDNEGNAICLALSNTIGTLQDMNVANDCLECSVYNNSGNLRFALICRSTDNSDFYYDGGDTSNLMYCTVTRSGTTLTLTLYSDASRTVVVDTLSLTSESGAKRYLYVCSSRDIGSVPADTITFYTQNVEIVTAS